MPWWFIWETPAWTGRILLPIHQKHAINMLPPTMCGPTLSFRRKLAFRGTALLTELLGTIRTGMTNFFGGSHMLPSARSNPGTVTKCDSKTHETSFPMHGATLGLPNAIRLPVMWLQ